MLCISASDNALLKTHASSTIPSKSAVVEDPPMKNSPEFVAEDPEAVTSTFTPSIKTFSLEIELSYTPAK